MRTIDHAKIIAVFIGKRWLHDMQNFRVDGHMAHFEVNWRGTGLRYYTLPLAEISGYEEAE